MSEDSVRRREIDPAFFSSDPVIACSIPARLLFIGLWTLADREGRMRDEPSRVKRQLYPDDQVDADALMAELATQGLIDRYVVDDVSCICIPSFPEFQHVHPREQASKLPPPQRGRGKARQGSPRADQGAVKPGGLSGPSVNSSPSVTPQTPRGDSFDREHWFADVWNESCQPLPRLRKPPNGATAERLVRKAMEFFDNDRALLAAAIKRAASDQHYRDGHYGYETFCRHVERWAEDVPHSQPENAIDRRIREASERGRHAGVPGTVIDMPLARHA